MDPNHHDASEGSYEKFSSKSMPTLDNASRPHSESYGPSHFQSTHGSDDHSISRTQSFFGQDFGAPATGEFSAESTYFASLNSANHDLHAPFDFTSIPWLSQAFPSDPNQQFDQTDLEVMRVRECTNHAGGTGPFEASVAQSEAAIG